MNYAIITVTHNGARLARRLQDKLGETVDIYVKSGRVPTDYQAANVTVYDRMSEIVKIAFYAYDALIFFTSTGIAVRMIAPFIVHKVKDPAVIVLDEQAHFAISLLSGHLGGANELTISVSNILGAVPVITTATDSQSKLAPDVIARRLDLIPYPLGQIKMANSALVAGRELQYFVDAHWERCEELMEQLSSWGINAQTATWDSVVAINLPAVFISPERRLHDKVLTLTPKRLIAGVGCRRGVSIELIDKALQQAKQLAECENLNIGQLVSTVVKADEVNLLRWAEQHQVPLEFFDNEIMQQRITEFNIPESAFVKSQIGIGNVCEAAILAYNKYAKIILPKTKFEKVTVSLGWE